MQMMNVQTKAVSTRIGRKKRVRWTGPKKRSVLEDWLCGALVVGGVAVESDMALPLIGKRIATVSYMQSQVACFGTVNARLNRITDAPKEREQTAGSI